MVLCCSSYVDTSVEIDGMLETIVLVSFIDLVLLRDAELSSFFIAFAFRYHMTISTRTRSTKGCLVMSIYVYSTDEK